MQSWFGENKAAGSNVDRTPEEQGHVDAATEKLALYHYDSCWFCGRVRAEIDRLRLKIELRNIHRDREYHAELVREGGSGTVPCLQIETGDGGVEWLYESSDIVAYLDDRFA